MTAFALALAEQPSPWSTSSWRTVFVLPSMVVVTSALAVASDLQPVFWLLVELDELLDEDDALAELDTDVLSADAIRISALMAINPPITPAATTAASSDRPLGCNTRIAHSFQKYARRRAAGNPGRPLANI
jgi:hypothetical protein